MKYLYLVLLLGVSFLTIQAQEVTRNFTTLTYNKSLQTDNVAPDNGEQLSSLEQQSAQFTRFSSTFEEKTIPIVFHVLYANEAQRVEMEQIEIQLAALNADFSLKEIIENHPNDPDGRYAKQAVDTKIRFCLATHDGEGNAISGVQYVPTSTLEWKETTGIKNNQDGSLAITPNRLLNIWIVALSPENAGFAQMPNRGLSQTDGVVINYHYFGETANENFGDSKTLTFLIAQYLNLYPLSGHSLDYPCSDDFVDDTPLHNSRNSGCPSNLHVSICTKSLVPEMLMNFMSANTSDNCKYMFTRGQAVRMQAVLDSTGVRHNLTLIEPICVDNEVVEASERSADNTKDNLWKDAQLSVYPNPATNQITIELNHINTNPSTIEILTADGKLVLFKTLQTNSQNLQTTINISELNAGFYLVKVRSNQNSLVQKLTIE